MVFDPLRIWLPFGGSYRDRRIKEIPNLFKDIFVDERPAPVADAAVTLRMAYDLQPEIENGILGGIACQPPR